MYRHMAHLTPMVIDSDWTQPTVGRHLVAQPAQALVNISANISIHAISTLVLIKPHGVLADETHDNTNECDDRCLLLGSDFNTSIFRCRQRTPGQDHGPYRFAFEWVSALTRLLLPGEQDIEKAFD
jgi:hypothetical protein